MADITISEILDDIRIADETLLKFERRYWITSEQFFSINMFCLETIYKIR